MLDAINRHILQPLAAAKNGSRHLHYLRRLRETQYDPPEVIQQRQLLQLQRVLHHAYATVPFYQRLWRAAGVHPAAVRTVADLQHFPVITKAELRQHEAEFLSTAYRHQPLVVKRTSGSTGVPLTIRIDERGKQWKYAATLRSDEWSGWRLGQRVAKVWGNPEYRHFGWRGRLRNWLLERAVYLDTIHLTDDRIAAFADTVRRHRPGLLFGHAHSLYLLAERLQRDGIVDIRPNGIISTAMPLHTWQRRVIETVFGVPVTNRYGCEEVSLIASECEEHRGLHINADSIYTEIENGAISGPLLVTDLSNWAMPLIRYRIGDHVTAARRSCPCGRGLPLLESVEGRDADFVVTPSGSLISGISLTENFALHITGTAQVQIVQESITLMRLRIVPSERFGRESRQQIARLVEQTFGPSMRHEVELVDAIPQEKSGKYRFCISKVAPRDAQHLNRNHAEHAA